MENELNDSDVGADRLRRHVLAAIDELAALHCSDPLAVDALLTAQLTMHTLRHVWLPGT